MGLMIYYWVTYSQPQAFIEMPQKSARDQKMNKKKLQLNDADSRNKTIEIINGNEFGFCIGMYVAIKAMNKPIKISLKMAAHHCERRQETNKQEVEEIERGGVQRFALKRNNGEFKKNAKSNRCDPFV